MTFTYTQANKEELVTKIEEYEASDYFPCNTTTKREEATKAAEALRDLLRDEVDPNIYRFFKSDLGQVNKWLDNELVNFGMLCNRFSVIQLRLSSSDN
jgi:hypothetical protein